MNREELSSLANIEENHWWFKERRELLRDWAQIFPISSKFLDIGAGAGRQSVLLRDELGMRVTAIELSDFGVASCIQNGVNVIQASATKLPLSPESYDAIVAMDVLEHIEDDVETLNEMVRVLKPSGYVFITVPAFPFMWSSHDVAVDHVRRYRKSDLAEKIENSKLSIVSLRYWNSLLFPLAIINRILFKTSDELTLPPNVINLLLTRVITLERNNRIVGSLPGTSMIVIARKQII